MCVRMCLTNISPQARVIGSVIKQSVCAHYTRCFYKQFCVLLDFIFGNYEGNYIDTTTINH